MQKLVKLGIDICDLEQHLGYYVSEAMDRSSDYIYNLQKHSRADFPLCGVLYILPLL